MTPIEIDSHTQQQIQGQEYLRLPMMLWYVVASTSGCMLCLLNFKRASMGV
jgi:hypothetical protein